MWIRCSAGLLLLVLSLAMPWSAPSRAQEATESPPPSQEELAEAFSQLSPKYRKWVESVIGLMSQGELEFFLGLAQDYRRDAFMEAFWDPRDPDRTTPQNELRERWEQYKTTSGTFPYGDPRFRLLLINGPPSGWSLPDGRPVALCFSRTKELEIWYYEASERSKRRFAVVFQRTAASNPYEVLLPGGRVSPVQRRGGLPVQDVRQLCAEELLGYTLREMQRVAGYDRLLEKVMTPVLPSAEWLANFSASAAELPAGAATFEVDLALSFPGRKQSRTAVQAMLAIEVSEAPGRRFATEDGSEELYHNFLLIGEVIKDGRLFESFRYRFEGVTPEGTGTIPLGFTRYLRSGKATLRLLLEDVFGGRYAQLIEEIDVPSPVGMEVVAAAAQNEGPAGARLRLVPPPGNVLAGKVRFRTSTRSEFEKVVFYLDDKEILSKRRPPYSVELDLGNTAEPRRVRVVGFIDGREAATDQLWLNQGAQRFRVRLIEPRPGGIYPGSLTARIEVDTPDASPPERLELYLNDGRVTTLREPPFTHRLKLSQAEVAVVRAVAYLADGTSAEDVVIVNASPFSETVEVRLVEVYALVTDLRGEALAGLPEEEFRIFEEGSARPLHRFEELKDAPVQAALLLDRSASMAPHLEEVKKAALHFATAILRAPEDRLAVFSFADDVAVDTDFTGSGTQVERALAGLSSHGGTAFYDGLTQTLNNFAEVAGHKVLVLFSDGQDETSRLSFEQALTSVRRSGVTIYTLGLDEAFADKEARRKLVDLAEESGGEAFFLSGTEELAASYDTILQAMRSRYLLAFEPSRVDTRDGFRTIRVEVKERGARVRARRGYYP